MENGLRKTLNPSIPIRQNAVDAKRESAGLEILGIDGVRCTMSPVTQEDRRCVALSQKKILEVVVVRGEFLKRSGTGGRRAYDKWASYCIIVVGPEVRVIPVEAVLAFCKESISEIAPWSDRVLFPDS